jgi:DNA segregation ATPase FtsK/SpoIIIE, S-DNA-T family
VADSGLRVQQAAALHRQAAATAQAAAVALEAGLPPAVDPLEQHALAEQLRDAARQLAPGWLGATLDAQSASTPLGGVFPPQFVRVGMAQLLDDVRFPAVVPLLGTGHLTVDANATDARVFGLLRGLLLRLLAAAPAGSLLVRAVDGVGGGQVFEPFTDLADAGLMSPPVTDRQGLLDVLAEADKWLRPGRGAPPRRSRRDRMMLVVIASLPQFTEGEELRRIASLAQQGPDSGLHLIVAGWPPPPLTAETTQPPLPRTTSISVRNPYGSTPRSIWRMKTRRRT